VSDKSAIEWTEATWNPLTGCTKVSPGCDHCYAETFAERFRGTPGHHFEQGFDLRLRPERLTQPLRWKRPRRIFVNSMSDLFHADVPPDFIARVLAVMALAPQHTFQLLTKRHARMRTLLSSDAFTSVVADTAYLMSTGEHSDIAGNDSAHRAARDGYTRLRAVAYSTSVREIPWPLPNLWLGVSVEDQHWADIRIPALLDTPAAVRWISAEPLLGDLHIARYVDRLDWVVVGGESGPGARPMHPQWARSLRNVCQASSTPFLFKQWGAWAPTGAIGIGTPLDCTPTGFVRQPPRRDPNRCYAGAPFQDVNGLPYSPEMVRVGKGKAGRELDGRTWDEYPGGDA
jgi:protein gp37